MIVELMITNRSIPMTEVRRPAPLAAMLSTLMLAALPLCSMAQQDHSSPMPAHEAQMHEHMQEGMQKHLDRLAARLEIRASQQEAWSAFATALRGLVPAKPPERPDHDLDAAARARLAADRATERARKLSVLADATAKLEQGLDAQQKQVLNEVARNFAHHGHGDMHSEHCHGSMHEGHGPWHEDHEHGDH
jgi:hypothetical protein